MSQEHRPYTVTEFQGHPSRLQLMTFFTFTLNKKCSPLD